MMIFKDIEGLVYYATAHLLLDELDVELVRNAILDELRITDYIISEVDYDAIDAMTCPDTLLDAIVNHAVGTGIVAEGKQECFKARIMGILSKRPSELSEVFDSLSKNPVRAFDFFYDYNIKNNFVQASKLAKIKHWEAKGTKGKLEVLLGCQCGSSPAKTDYPQCPLCLENQGFAPSALQNMRALPVTLDGSEYRWHYDQRGFFAQQIVVASNDHAPSQLDFAKLLQLSDFAPHYFVGFDGGEKAPHHSFEGGFKAMPLFKAPVLRTFKAPALPLVTISEVAWYTNVLRIVGIDADRVAFAAEELTKALQSAPGAEASAVSAVVRRDKESKYIVELIVSKQQKCEEALNIKNCRVALVDLLGLVILCKNFEQQSRLIEQYLSKEVKYSAAALPAELAQHKEMIERLIKEVGSAKLTPLEAQLTLKDEINRLCERILASTVTFEIGENGADGIQKIMAGFAG